MLKTSVLICAVVFGWLVVKGSIGDDRFESLAANSYSHSEPELTPERIQLLRNIAASVSTNDSVSISANDTVQDLTPERVQVRKAIAMSGEKSISHGIAIEGSYSYEQGDVNFSDGYFVSDDGVFDRHWVVSQNANHYTIQLAMTVNRAFLLQFSEQLPSGFDVALYPERTTDAGFVQYSLSTGSFASKEHAEAALVSLSSDLRRYGAYARKFEDIHNSSI